MIGQLYDYSSFWDSLVPFWGVSNFMFDLFWNGSMKLCIYMYAVYIYILGIFCEKILLTMHMFQTIIQKKENMLAEL